MFVSEWREFSSAPCLAGSVETWWQLASRCCWNRGRPWHASELVSFLIGLRTYQHPGIYVYICLFVAFHCNKSERFKWRLYQHTAQQLILVSSFQRIFLKKPLPYDVRGSSFKIYHHTILTLYVACSGPGSSVSIATGYGLGGPGSNPGGDEIFRPSRTALRPTQPPVKWVLVLSRG